MVSSKKQPEKAINCNFYEARPQTHTCWR
jgi:hypothetical protein